MNTPIELRSDNAAGCAPEILEAIGAANAGSALAYGGDEWTEELQAIVREVFEHAEATIFPVVSGIAANSLALSAMCPPWGAVLCHETAHIIVNECGATSLFGGGAVMHGVGGDGYRVSPEALRQAFENARWGDNHHSQPAVLSLTQPSDFGTLYSRAQIAELAALARERGLSVHVDGARIANALVALGGTPADLTWRAGVEVLSLGAIKNGGLSADAIVCFKPAVAEQLHYRIKRAGHVASKMRFQSAQLQAYLRDGLWLHLAGRSNAAMARLAKGLRALGLELLNEPDVNIAFVQVEDELATRLERAGLLFYRISTGVVRFVTSFQTTDAEIDDALARVQAAL